MLRQSGIKLRSKGWRSPDLQSRGMRIRVLSPLKRFTQVPSYSPRRLEIRVQCSTKDLHKAVEGPSTRPIVFSMIAGSYCRPGRHLSKEIRCAFDLP